MQQFQCNLQPEIQEPHRTTHTDTTTRCKTHTRNNSRTKRPQPQPPHRRGSFHRWLQPLYTENTRFRAPASSPTHSPCNIMQQFQCNLQPEIQEPHRTTHTDTTTRCKTHRRNNSRTKWPQPQPPHRRGSFHRRLQPLDTEKHKVSCSGFLNIMQQFQCNLQPEIQEPHRTTHTDTTTSTRCKTHTRNNSRTKRPQPQPPHRRGSFHRRLQPLYTENTRFRAPASSPTHSPCNIMQQFQCNLQPEIQEPHRPTHTDTTTRCKTHRRNNSRTKRPQPQPPHRRGSFHRRLQPLYTEKHKVSCSGFLPNTQPMQHHAAIPMQSATRDSRTA